ncbi:hypothetical protein DYB28_002155 [Aphanomyces astaci]|uniref:Uncharacterized protein n=1 Tax=Aphanomyces astaci TaxID=112090 RepID=A0A9X8E3A0_APHAT|nr:hypothetical protein DYB28_002155 [Aphanomyces astaci]
MMRVFFVAAVAVCATSTKHRWAQDPCVDVEGDACFCCPSSNVCTSTHFGECPTSNTHAEAKCTEDAPSFHPTGTYQGRCVLKVDTHCVERSTGFVCGYMGEPQRGAGPEQEVGEAQHPFEPVPAGKSHHPFEPDHAGKSRHPSEPDQGGKAHHPFKPDQVGEAQRPFEPVQGGKSQHPFEPNQEGEGRDPVEPDQVRITYHPFEHDQVGKAQRPVEEGEKVHQAVVHSDAAAVPTAKEDIKSSSNTVGITVGVVGVAAVAAVAFMAIRKKNSRKSGDKPDNLVTPEVPHPDHKAPNLLGSGPLTPSLNAEKSKIFSV